MKDNFYSRSSFEHWSKENCDICKNALCDEKGFVKKDVCDVFVMLDFGTRLDDELKKEYFGDKEISETSCKKFKTGLTEDDKKDFISNYIIHYFKGKEEPKKSLDVFVKLLRARL